MNMLEHVRRSPRRRRRPAAILLVALPLLCGCAVLAVGAIAAGAAYGVVKYTDNEALRDYAADLGTTWSATRAEMRDMGYAVADEIEAGPSGGKIESGDAKVEVKTVSEKYTRVSVRIGTFETDAHKAKAARLLDGVARRLGE